MAKSLYGGEAMTTNQTIDGVPRKSLEQALKLAAVFDDGGDGADAESARGVVWILRALLDKEVSGDSRAPQHQGEPVAWLAQAVGKGGEVYRNKASTNEPTMRDIEIAWGQGVIDRFTIVIKPLYAEQPAPVAVVLPERKSVNTHNSHDWDEGHADGWVAYDTELKRLNPSL